MMQGISAGLAVGALALSYLAAAGANGLPSAVQQAVQKRFPDAQVYDVDQDDDNAGVYEVELASKAGTIDAEFFSNGEFIKSDEDLTWAAVPQAIQQAIEKAHPQSTRRDVDRNTRASRNGDHVSYTVELIDGGREREMLIDPQGKVLVDRLD